MVTCARPSRTLEIYEIQEVWTGLRDLQYANDALKSSPKDLWFFSTCGPFGIAEGHGPKRDSSSRDTPSPHMWNYPTALGAEKKGRMRGP